MIPMCLVHDTYVPRLLRKDVPTLLGSTVEGEFVCDSSARPLPVQELSDNYGSSQPEKCLPVGAARLALVAASYQVRGGA